MLGCNRQAVGSMVMFVYFVVCIALAVGGYVVAQQSMWPDTVSLALLVFCLGFVGTAIGLVAILGRYIGRRLGFW